MRRLVAVTAALFLTSLPLLGARAATVANDEPEARGAASITREALMRTDRWLADPARGGRLAGSPGYVAAAQEMARQLAAAGLAPAGEDGYFQHVEVEYNPIARCVLSMTGSDGLRRALRLGPDYTCRGLTGSATLEAPVVFAGYGISAPERGYDDYAGIDARGKVVLVIKDAPPFRADTSGWGDRTLTRPRIRDAAAHGAIGLLMVPSPRQPHPQRPIGSMLEGPGPEDTTFPAMQVDVPVAEALLAGSGATLPALQAVIDSTHAPASRALASRVGMDVRATYDGHHGSLNVIGRIPGSDPALRGECVVIGAHLDHVGTQGKLMFRGANDNASGSAALLEVARAFTRAGAAPKRTVIFAFFTSEEAGLHGSKYFVAHPPVPRASLVAYVNLDCVAVGDSIEAHGGRTYGALWQIVQAADARESRRLIQASGPGGGADAESFHLAGIPTTYFASHFSYTHLHLPSDTPETLNPELFEATARTAFRTAWTLAQGAPAK